MLKSLRNNYHILFSTLAVMMLMMSGCHSSKSQYTGNLNTEVSTANSNELFKEMAESYSDWTDLYVPVNFQLLSPKQFSVSGRATMVYGKEINISLRMLGMEVAVIYVNETTLYVVDKYNKRYLCEDISGLLSGYDLTLIDLQNILLGRVTNFGNGTITTKDSKDFAFLEADNLWVLTPKKQRANTELNYIATKTDPPVLSDIALRIANKGMISIAYTEPSSSPAGIISGILTATVPYKQKEIVASIVSNLNEAKWNEGRSVSFKDPSSSYKKMEVESLLKMF